MQHFFRIAYDDCLSDFEELLAKYDTITEKEAIHYAWKSTMHESMAQVLPQDPTTLYRELNATFNTHQHSKRFNKGEKESLFPELNWRNS